MMTTNIKKKLYAIPAIFALANISSIALAAPLNKLTDQWYLGGSLGLSNMSPNGGETWKTTDSNGISKKIYLGADISRQFGLETFWADFGDAKLKSRNGERGKVSYSAIGANLVYNAPKKIAGLRPLAKLGVAKFNNKDSGAVNSQQNNKLTIFGGLGVEFALTKHLSLRSEYEYYDEDISHFSVGVNWSPKYRDHSFYSRQRSTQQKRIVTQKSQPDVINIYVPPAPKAKPPRIITKVQKAKPRIVYRPAPKVIPQYKMIHKTLSGGSHFGSGSAQLTLDGKNVLDKLARDLNQQSKTQSIRIIGHTDSIGSVRSNLSLSYARANAVASYLTFRGMNRQLINTQGLGESRPIADNRTKRGRALNRRVEITVKSKNRVRVR